MEENTGTRGGTSRRRFLGSLAGVTGGMALAAGVRASEQADGPGLPPMRRRKLGRNGPEVTILTMGGTMKALDQDFIDHCWDLGIRSFDMADCYLGGRAEGVVAEWIRRHPERRGELFLVSKDHPVGGLDRLPAQLDRRLEACGTDYLDLFFIHGLGPKEYGEASMDWPRSGEFRRMIERLKGSGKARLVGFSCHDRELLPLLRNAAEGGFVDVIMLRYNVFFTPGDEFDRAVQACHDRGIGLIAMKEMRAARDAARMIPELEGLGLTTHQGVLHKVWSDERISAVCSAMDSKDIVVENTDAARRYAGPLDGPVGTVLRDAVRRSRVALCPGCAACLSDPMAYAYDDISRYVAYYEQDADPSGRDRYRALPAEARRYAMADLEALRDRCAYHVDYPEIARRAERYFGGRSAA